MKKMLNHIAFLLLFAVVLCTPSCWADTIPVQALQTDYRTVAVSWEEGYGTVSLYRLYPGQNQASLVSTTASTSWTDHQQRSVCDDTVRYIVTNGIDSGFAAANVVDNNPTSPAQWGVVTMDHSISQIVLQWEPSPDNDIMGYLVCEGTPSIAIDTVFGRDNNLYVFDAEDSICVHQFRICAFDSCRQASQLTELCNNIVVIVQNEPCSQTYRATWNRYFNMPGDVGSYELWVSQNGASFQRTAVVQSNDPTSVEFNVDDNCSLLKLYVRAVSVSGAYTALSNLITIDISSALLPENLFLRTVSVVGPQQDVTIVAQTDEGWQQSEISIYRRVEGGTRSVVARCHPTPQGRIVWTDSDVKPGEKVYYYSVGVSDMCGRNEKRSNEACTILPTLEDNGGVLSLAWNPYTGWDGTTTYNVYSSGPDGVSWSPEGSTTATSLAALSGDVQGRRHYMVVACEGTNSHYQLDDSVQSAIVSYMPHTSIWMPNAITPFENSNNTVCPQASYINPDGYSFSVFNRQGFSVFHSDMPGESWDGRKNGIALPAGTYVYRITYRQSDGTDQILIGTITIIY